MPKDYQQVVRKCDALIDSTNVAFRKSSCGVAKKAAEQLGGAIVTVMQLSRVGKFAHIQHMYVPLVGVTENLGDNVRVLGGAARGAGDAGPPPPPPLAGKRLEAIAPKWARQPP